jgi:hypothetical protein
MDQPQAPAPVYRSHDSLPSHGLAQPDTDPLLAEQERNAAAIRNAPAAPPLFREKRSYKPRQPKTNVVAAVAPPHVPAQPVPAQPFDPSQPLFCSFCRRKCPTTAGFLHVSHQPYQIPIRETNI